jgi:hypothetical protein
VLNGLRPSSSASQAHTLAESADRPSGVLGATVLPMVVLAGFADDENQADDQDGKRDDWCPRHYNCSNSPDASMCQLAK